MGSLRIGAPDFQEWCFGLLVDRPTGNIAEKQMRNNKTTRNPSEMPQQVKILESFLNLLHFENMLIITI